MDVWAAAVWGLAGGLCVEALELYAGAVRAHSPGAAPVELARLVPMNVDVQAAMAVPPPAEPVLAPPPGDPQVGGAGNAP